MTSLFLSTSEESASETEIALWNEIYGCVNYLKIPYDTVMTMPVYVRKFWIMKHNEENKQQTESKTNTIEGQSINNYARLEQSNIGGNGAQGR